MAEKTTKQKKIDIFELGKREKIVVLTDPDNPEMCAEVRLVRMKKSEAEKAFSASRNAYNKAKEDLKKQEENTKLFTTLAEKFDRKTKIETILTPFRVELEQNIDLVEIVDEKAKIAGMKEAGKDEDEITVELEKEAQERIDEKVAEKRASYEKFDDEKLQSILVEQLINMEAQRVSNDTFIERALCYMTYYPEKDELVFSDDPKNERYVTNALRSAVIYYQLVTAYRGFLVSLNMTPKQIREQTKRGGDFFTLHK
jgi:hypothetical protein